MAEYHGYNNLRFNKRYVRRELQRYLAQFGCKIIGKIRWVTSNDENKVDEFFVRYE